MITVHNISNGDVVEINIDHIISISERSDSRAVITFSEIHNRYSESITVMETREEVHDAIILARRQRINPFMMEISGQLARISNILARRF